MGFTVANSQDSFRKPAPAPPQVPVLTIPYPGRNVPPSAPSLLSSASERNILQNPVYPGQPLASRHQGIRRCDQGVATGDREGFREGSCTRGKGPASVRDCPREAESAH